jgi:hypothetical protein
VAHVTNANMVPENTPYYEQTRVFEITEEEYEALQVGSLIHVTLAFE